MSKWCVPFFAGYMICFICRYGRFHAFHNTLDPQANLKGFGQRYVTTQNVVTLQNVVFTTFCLALALASIGKM